MAYKPILTPQAESDIAEAFAYLSERAPEAAARWYRHVREGIASLAEMPLRCPMAPEGAKLGLELRHLLYGNRPSIYRIVFRVVEEVREVHVLAIRHAARKPLTDEEVQPFVELP